MVQRGRFSFKGVELGHEMKARKSRDQGRGEGVEAGGEGSEGRQDLAQRLNTVRGIYGRGVRGDGQGGRPAG